MGQKCIYCKTWIMTECWCFLFLKYLLDLDKVFQSQRASIFGTRGDLGVKVKLRVPRSRFFKKSGYLRIFFGQIWFEYPYMYTFPVSYASPLYVSNFFDAIWGILWKCRPKSKLMYKILENWWTFFRKVEFWPTSRWLRTKIFIPF